VVSVGDWFTYYIYQVVRQSSAPGFQDFLLVGDGVILDSFAVNGIPGGNSTVGTARATDWHVGRFQAPRAEPSPPTVTVTATVKDGARTVPVSAKVRISGDEGYFTLDAVENFRRTVTRTKLDGGLVVEEYVQNRLEMKGYLVRLGGPLYFGLGAGAAYAANPEPAVNQILADFKRMGIFDGPPPCAFRDFTYQSWIDSRVLLSSYLNVYQTPGGFDPHPMLLLAPLRFVMTGDSTEAKYVFAPDPLYCSLRTDIPSPTVTLGYSIDIAPDSFPVDRTVGDKFLVGRHWISQVVGPGNSVASDARGTTTRIRIRFKIPYAPQ
jgi:hypothetical protein